MLAGLARKARQLRADPTLRRWLIGRALGRYSNPAPFVAHCPPYAADGLPLEKEIPGPSQPFPSLEAGHPTSPLTLDLPGASITLNPGSPEDVFATSFDDVETLLALYRFQWVCAAGDDVDPAWVGLLWQAWCDRFSEPDDGWAWHPYTAAERAANIIRFARQFGMPGDIDTTLESLAAHGPAIASRLEYFGDHDTSNHLANNGRGLFLLGVELGMPGCADLGEKILLNEAARIFRPGGILREGSSHYHALLTSHYTECAALASRHALSSASALEDIASRARHALAQISLPSGLPLVGDISPDLPPAVLLRRLDISPEPGDDLTPDGWLRFQQGDWSGLWHCSPDGWSHMPGHGHQDCGAFELHYRGAPVFVDPGRGAYGEDGEAALYRSAHVHNTLIVDGADPYPANKPYYSDGFRSQECGQPPTLGKTDTGVVLSHAGYSRFGSVGAVTREWNFTATGFTLADFIDGERSHQVVRILVTPLDARLEGDTVMLEGQGLSFRLSAATRPEIKPIKIWHAYGAAHQGTQIIFNSRTNLPWSGTLTVEVIA